MKVKSVIGSDAMRKIVFVSIALGGFCPSVAAHPHVWITMRSDVVFNDEQQVSGIGVMWVFDEAYAQMATDGLDTNGDGVYSQSELEPLTQQNLASLKEYQYFLYLRVNGEAVAINEPVKTGQIYSDGKLALHFQVPLVDPVDPRKSEVLYKIYDPEFFIAIDYIEQDPVGVVGTMPSGCKIDLKPVISDQELMATQEMLSSKRADWQPPANEDFGGMFARPALIDCKG